MPQPPGAVSWAKQLAARWQQVVAVQQALQLVFEPGLLGNQALPMVDYVLGNEDASVRWGEWREHTLGNQEGAPLLLPNF